LQLVHEEKGIRRRRAGREVPPLLQLSIKLAVMVMAHAVNQFARVATLPARLLMLTGRILMDKLQMRKPPQNSVDYKRIIQYNTGAIGLNFFFYNIMSNEEQTVPQTL
jgi:hypothetical protein